MHNGMGKRKIWRRLRNVLGVNALTSGRYREEVFNVLLAILLHRRGIVSAPEQALRESVERRRYLPDVMVIFRGLRTVIEGKVDDQADGEKVVLEQARDRVTRGIAHIGIAVVYPASLRNVAFADLESRLEGASLRITVCSEAGELGWMEGNPGQLANMLERTFEQLVAEDVVTKAAEVLDAGASAFAKRTFNTPDLADRAAKILGISPPPQRGRRKAKAEEDDE